MSDFITIPILLPVIITIFLTFIIYQLSKKEKDFVYDNVTVHLSLSHIKINEKLKIYYEEKEIDSLSITKVSFCIKGLETIHETDISETDQLFVGLIGKDIEILNANLTYQSRPVNRFSIAISKDKNKINISFDFLDRNDGAIMQILYTGIGEIKVIGTIKGNKTKEIQKNFDSTFEKNFGKVMDKIIIKNNLIAALQIILLLLIAAIIFTIGYIPEMITKFSKRLPKKFVLSK